MKKVVILLIIGNLFITTFAIARVNYFVCEPKISVNRDKANLTINLKTNELTFAPVGTTIKISEINDTSLIAEFKNPINFKTTIIFNRLNGDLSYASYKMEGGYLPSKLIFDDKYSCTPSKKII